MPDLPSKQKKRYLHAAKELPRFVEHAHDPLFLKIKQHTSAFVAMQHLETNQEQLESPNITWSVSSTVHLWSTWLADSQRLTKTDQRMEYGQAPIRLSNCDITQIASVLKSSVGRYYLKPNGQQTKTQDTIFRILLHVDPVLFLLKYFFSSSRSSALRAPAAHGDTPEVERGQPRPSKGRILGFICLKYKIRVLFQDLLCFGICVWYILVSLFLTIYTNFHCGSRRVLIFCFVCWL